MLDCCGQEAAETEHRVTDAVVDLEQPVSARHLQQHPGLRRERRQLQVAVAADHLRQTMQQHFHPGGVHLLYLRAVENDLRPVGVEDGIDLPQERLRLFQAQAFGKSFHHYGPIGFHISSLLPYSRGTKRLPKMPQTPTARNGARRPWTPPGLSPAVRDGTA